MWIRADLQVHCSFHDDGRSAVQQLWHHYSKAGYDAVYLTPHADLAGEYWAELVRLCQNLPRDGARLFPGLEVAVKYDRGHLLAYGLPDIRGLENQALAGPVLAQRILDKARAASFSVAHPYGSRSWNWLENPLTGSFGLEIMSGFQTDFSLEGASIHLWRRLWQGGATVSVRTGSDWHGNPLPFPAYATFLPVPVRWREMGWREQKHVVDLALARGWTTVSKNGSLAVLRLYRHPPGAIIQRPRWSTNLPFYIWFRPETKGTYRLALIRDDAIETPLWEKEVRVGDPSLGPYLWATTTYSASSRHYYWLYGEGSDYLYTTPILVV